MATAMSAAAEILEEENQEEELTEVAMMDDLDAEYMMKRIREANEECEKMVSWYKTMISRYELRRDRIVEWAEGNLRTYFETVPKKETKTQKSYELPSGKLVMKHQDPTFSQDDEKLVPWLKENQMAEFIKVKESAKWADLKKVLKVAPDGNGMMAEDGEIVPGILVTPREDKFTVTIK